MVAYNLIGLTQDAAIKFRTVESRIVGTRGGTSRHNAVLSNIFYHCGKSIDFPNADNIADWNLYTRDWGGVTDENQGVGRGLNWISLPGSPSILDLEAWQKYFGFDKHGAYAEMHLDIDLDRLTLTGSVTGELPQAPTDPHFRRDLLGAAAGENRNPGPLLQPPRTASKVAIDPRKHE